MDRRRFLQAGLAGGALLGGAAFVHGRSRDAATRSGAQLPASAAAPRGIKCSLKWGMIGEGRTVIEKFRLLKELGYDGVELDSPGAPDFAEVKDAIAATGVVVPGVVDSVHWSKTLGDPDEKVRGEGRDALETALRDAAEIGASTVLLVPAVVNEQIPYHLAYERSQTEIRRLLPLAAELGVTIAFENVWNNFLLSPLEAARYVDEFESPHVAWYLDVGNLVHYGWPEHWVQVLGKRIAKLDIKDYSRTKCNEEGLWAGFDCEIGDGDANYPRVMAALDAIGYRGWASAEVGGGNKKRLADVLARMRRVLDS